MNSYNQLPNIDKPSLNLIKESLFENNEDCPVINDYIYQLFSFFKELLETDDSSLGLKLQEVNNNEEKIGIKYLLNLFLYNIKKIKQTKNEINKKIRELFEEYENNIKDFSNYRKNILKISNLTKESIDFWENIFTYPDKDHLLVYRQLIKELSNEELKKFKEISKLIIFNIYESEYNDIPIFNKYFLQSCFYSFSEKLLYILFLNGDQEIKEYLIRELKKDKIVTNNKNTLRKKALIFFNLKKRETNIVNLILGNNYKSYIYNQYNNDVRNNDKIPSNKPDFKPRKVTDEELASRRSRPNNNVRNNDKIPSNKPDFKPEKVPDEEFAGIMDRPNNNQQIDRFDRFENTSKKEVCPAIDRNPVVETKSIPIPPITEANEMTKKKNTPIALTGSEVYESLVQNYYIKPEQEDFIEEFLRLYKLTYDGLVQNSK